MVKYLTQEEITNLDIELMNELAFETSQLMELAGLSVAQCVYSEFNKEEYNRVLVLVGPGNCGGDALVCARHLTHFGYSCTLLICKPPKKALISNLIKQCEILNIPIISEVEESDESSYDVLVDGFFGYSFKGDIREPYNTQMNIIKNYSIPMISVDVPSGWDINKGNSEGKGFEPQVLISLTAPKLCAKYFKGSHWVGGRFVPPIVAEKYELNLPEYEDDKQIVKLPLQNNL
eukprot:TRINITY_DN2480_c0_g1_i1.p1 TRINITY_DN2480_c0_g1~~TRINITY_DN2480_c0_g1_i1.p1  ORF type:complete len:233 (-),score=67.30 TRINITY_DN2480_c0_g1_i1:123-821(-)